MKTKIQKYTLWSLMAALLMLSAQSGASVWEHDREWGASDDLAFSRWVSRSVKTTFFKDLGGSYKYLRLDCADALYGLRIYFAAKNRISFSARKGKITNEMDRYDHIQNEDRRIAKFIAYVAGQIGTETMAHNDTYSVSIRSLRPGDLFMYKYTTNGTSYTRHSYIIKNINVDGTFDVLYSTQARRDSGRPMARVRHESFQHKPLHYGSNKYGWGFRRWKRPSQAHLNQSQICNLGKSF